MLPIELKGFDAESGQSIQMRRLAGGPGNPPTRCQTTPG
jgi:hypothetical protein